MSTAPGRPSPTPKWIVGDTDALLQLTAIDQFRIVQQLRRDYGIQIIIAERVDSELRRKIYDHRFKPYQKILEKALDSPLLYVVSEEFLAPTIGEAAQSVMDNVESRADGFRRLGIGWGEAYSHAVGAELNLPVLSNDRQALDQIRNGGATIDRTMLRLFDLVVFGYQTGLIDAKDCDVARQTLASIPSEHVERCFNGTSFDKGLPHFYPRLVDGTKAFVGSPRPLGIFDSRLTIYPKAAASSS